MAAQTSPQALLGHGNAFEGSADVAGALPGPHHVAERHGSVVEGADAHAAVQGGGKKGVTGAQAGAQDAELFIALLLRASRCSSECR